MVDLISLSSSINLYASTVSFMFSSSFSLPFLSFGFSFFLFSILLVDGLHLVQNYFCFCYNSFSVTKYLNV